MSEGQPENSSARADVPPGQARWATLAALLLPAACAWVFYVTLSHEVAARVDGLRCLENYAFASFNQVLFNFSETGRFFQTLHRGYDDNWMWTGHKAATLPVVGLIYGLRPSPVWLGQILVGGVALGAFPAWALGRWSVQRAIAGPPGALLGGVAGLAMYFGFAPIYYMALQDYQDAVFGIPALLLAITASRRGSWLGFALSALLVSLVREELALMVALVGLGVPGSIRHRLKFMALGSAVAGTYLAVVWLFWHDQMHFESPAQTQLKYIFSTFPPSLPTLTYDKQEALRFYVGLILPVQWLSLLSPVTLLPGVGALFVHLMVNPGNAVDRVWGPNAHIHHLAPIIPLLVGAALESLGWILARLRGYLERWNRQMALGTCVIAVLSVVIAAAWVLPSRIANLELEPGISLRHRPHPVHPLWTLVRRIPADAAVATDTFASLVIAVRQRAYTYDESFQDKLRGQPPLEAVDALLVNLRDSSWLERATDYPGAKVLGDAAGYRLIQLRPNLESRPR